MRRFPTLDVKSAKVQATLDAMVARHVAHEPTIGIHELGLTALDGRPNPGALDYIDHMPPAEQRQLKQGAVRHRYAAAARGLCRCLWQSAGNADRDEPQGHPAHSGTDLGGAFTYHRELELFAKLGMTPAEVLSRATLEMAAYLHQDQQLVRSSAASWPISSLCPAIR